MCNTKGHKKLCKFHWKKITNRSQYYNIISSVILYFALHREAVRWPFPPCMRPWRVCLASASTHRHKHIIHLYRVILNNNSHIGVQQYNCLKSHRPEEKSISPSPSLSFSPLSHAYIHTLSFYISALVPLVLIPAARRRCNNINTIARILLHITHTRLCVWDVWRWTSIRERD